MVPVSNEARLTFCSNVWEESVKDSWCFFLWHWCGCLLNQLRFFGKKKKNKKNRMVIYLTAKGKKYANRRDTTSPRIIWLYFWYVFGKVLHYRMKHGSLLIGTITKHMASSPRVFNSGIKFLSGRAELLRRRPWNVTQWMTLDIIQASFHGQH